jgi:hypothetical protein
MLAISMSLMLLRQNVACVGSYSKAWPHYLLHHDLWSLKNIMLTLLITEVMVIRQRAMLNLF